MKKITVFLILLSLLLTMTGCKNVPNETIPDTVSTEEKQTSSVSKSEQISKLDNIPFEDGQLYAAAYLGYEEMEDLAYYTDNYLDDENLPVHYISNGEFYLIIPRYKDMTMKLYKNDIETSESVLVYEEAVSRPFIVKCNISDIFPDVKVCLTHNEETIEFSPYISLKDGSVEVGEYGLDITQNIQ